MKYFLFLFFAIFTCWASGFSNGSTQRCGIPILGGKVVGGVDSGGYRYPWFALLLLKDNEATTSTLPVPVCAGSLITEIHVLTAAHCLTISSSIEKKNLYNVALGVYNICNNKEKTREIFSVSDVAVHENYKKSGKFYDIALLKLNRRAPFTTICLPFFGVPDITELALLVGFGSTSENSNSVPCTMLEVNVTKFSREQCLKTDLPEEDKKESSILCAGSFSGKVDSCYGDSGGPLLTKNKDGRYVIAGIVSYGYGCATPKVPGIYTNVGSYLLWITKKISELNYSEEVSEVNSTSESQHNSFFRIKHKSELNNNENGSVIFPKSNNNFKSRTEIRLNQTWEKLGKERQKMLNVSVNPPVSDHKNTKVVITPINSQIYFP